MKDAPAKAHNETGYVAFLRGELKVTFESMGFQNVRTFINSGNVVFEAREQARSNLVKRIEQELKKSFGHDVAVILRTIREIQELVDSDPFKRVKVTPQTRLYVTFLAEKPNSNMKIPYESPEKDFKILSVQGDAVLSVVTLTAKRGTTEAMGHLEKGFGKKVTTRNWNTIVKIQKK